MALSIGLLLSAQAMAQDADHSARNKSADPVTQLDAIEVKGVRASLIKSQAIKHDAEQIVDSVSAEDIGALPDRSVTETLQRVSGVTIDHFMARNDPDHFSAEGSGVMIRGMTQVRGELNGRDSFSAASGRGLSFEDVPAELMAGVDVYKNPSAEIIEGGLGGTVNLRTRMPFDQPGRVIGFTADENYGDFSKTYKPSGSFLFSDRWNTGVGEMGLMLDVAYSALATRSDGIQVEQFVRRTDPALLAGTDFDKVYVPGGVNWRQLDFERKRKGVAGAFQWRPSDDTDIYVQYMRSTYDMNWQERAAFFNDDTNLVGPAPGTTFSYDADGRFVRGSPVSSSPRGNITGNDGVRFYTDNRYAQQSTTTSDLSGGFSHKLTSNLTVRGDMQLVRSESDALDFTLFSSIYLPGLTFDLSGKYPSVSIADSSYTSNPSNYFWSAAMDHLAKNRGRELATRFDLEYTYDDTAWLRTFRAGIRATDRTQTNKNSGYNWGVISDNWAKVPGTANGTGLADLASYMTASSQLSSFSNLFRGKISVPNSLYFPSNAAVKDYAGTSKMIEQIVALRGSGWAPDQYQLQDTNRQFERTQAAYAVLYFGNDDALGVPVDGNVGVRIVQTKTEANGYGQFPDLLVSTGSAELKDQYTGQFFPNNAQGSYTNVLPSFNMRFKFSDALQWRLAASKAMARPDYIQLQPYLLLAATPESDGTVSKWTGTAGNPNLKPMKANQYDTALEWYFDTSDMMYLTLFYKDVKDYFSNQTLTEVYDGRPWLVTRPYNMAKGRIRGFEYGYTQFFDSWPGWLSGFGVNANFTFVDSSGGVNSATDPFTKTTVTGVSLPLEGLSRRSYNLAGIYEKGPLSVRLAYNWRSRYLLTASDVSTKLPTWSDDYGQLDASVFYRFTPHLQLGVQANNLTNTVTKVLMGPTSYTGGEVDNHLYTRSWFVNDRRYSLVLRANW
ncbi:TonB-dependent receptor [Xanthomonas graminis]|jgi:TonB-dependent receptor|uniref:TonB-dependent receptor n=1 Tax=Xanthomonas graminis pv. graminis TaxID=134874 RepID=A0A1M4J7Z7_9XANT|nr:TonB-dependent receptor [Xanthomonas translucens]EKU24387.1 TonB-dependent outer membrane receptor [Xanthomonas translucens pv. graminis ART-Xtg29]SBV41313.1 TonB-dependent receptor [Xanthomonas translucens pv. graminis]SBV41849.1 TonB-dependent receptor [Xanthomonas translucens pv. graminis]SBV46991.1 TonB-dependent receptor [Xanthomonas translucens pv. graminis ART-Xtg29]SBV54978.1 TonB-dependent receptor [Xanthomonas translucens pv. graminis]